MTAQLLAATPRTSGAPAHAGAAAVAEGGAGAPRHAIGGLREARVRGWSIGTGGAPSEIRVLARGVEVPIGLRRLGRPDLLPAAPGQPVPPIGFVAEIDPAAWRHAGPDGRVTLQVELDGRLAEQAGVLDAKSLAAWCAGLGAWPRPDEREVWRLLSHVAASGLLARLPRRAAAWVKAAAEARGLGAALRDGDADGRIALGARLHLRIDRQRPLELDGWLLDPAGTRPGLALSCNGEPVAVEPSWLGRPDLAEAFRVPPEPRGFRVELPVAIWAHADARGECAVRIEAHGRRLPAEAWRVDAQALRAERAALETMAQEHDPARRAEALRRLASLRAHAAAIPSRAGWGAEDRAGIAALVAAFASVDPSQAAAAGIPRTEAPGAAPASAPDPEAPPLRANLEAWESFILQGWAMDAVADGEVFTLESHGQPVECHVARTSRVDVSQALEVDNEYLGFDIQLPAAIWRTADARGMCLLVLRVNGVAIHPEPLLVDAAALERAIAQALPDEIDALPPAVRAAGARLRLAALPLLLEHVEALGGAGRLSAPTRARLAHAAGRLALGAMLGLSGPTLGPAEAERARTIHRRRVWRLQRLLNARIDRRGGVAPGVLEAALDDVLADPDATGEVRTELLMSAAPLCSGDPAFDRLARELPLEAVEWLAETGDNWARSIRLAFLAHAGDLHGAAAELDRIAEAPGRGWINTECVALAVRAACDSPRVDAAGLQHRAAIVRAFARLLDRMPGDAWSRLHDRELVEAAAGLLLADGPWPDPLADELVRVVLRCHGLVPNFWTCLGSAPAGLAGAERVRAARAVFDAAVAALHALDTRARVPPDLAAVLEGLHDAHVGGQRDAMQWMRELAQQALAQPLPAGGVAATDPAADALRQRLPDLFEAGDRARFDLLPALALCPRPSSTRGLEQRVAADRARLAAAPGASVAAADIEAAFARLARMLPALCTPETGFRGQAALAEVLRDAGRLGVTGPALHALERLRSATDAAEAAHRQAAAGETTAPARLGDEREASLWPTTAAADPAPASGGNRLRLVSAPEQLRRLDEARLVVVCVVRDERLLLPHFLAHHRALGATAFVMVDNLSTDGTREFLAAQPDVVLYSADTDYRDSHFGVSWQQAVLAAHAQGRWALLVDADEFLLYPGCEHTPLPVLLDRLDAAGHDAARTPMIDMYPRGPLREADFARMAPAAAAAWFDRAPLLRWHVGGGLYSEAATWLSALRHRLIPHSPPNAFTAQKTALLRWRPWMRLSEGLHYVAGVRPAPQALFLGHYKYHAGFREKVLREVERKQHYDAASEYVHYLHLVAEPDSALFDPDVSVRLDGSGTLPDLGEAAR